MYGLIYETTRSWVLTKASLGLTCQVSLRPRLGLASLSELDEDLRRFSPLLFLERVSWLCAGLDAAGLGPSPVTMLTLVDDWVLYSAESAGSS